MQSVATSKIADMEFFRKLKRLCAERDLSRRGLAELMTREGVEVGKSKTATWFSGKHEPSLSEARWLADYFGVSLEYLGRPEIEEPREGYLSPDERDLVGVFRGLRISKQEAARRLAAPIPREDRVVFGPPPEQPALPNPKRKKGG